ncbi:50S ribosomal protein L1 [Patescibacteria group bacterium]|nr:50S ribosomal protein L1 [Patescibacteria group bacterium]MCL5797664.1 50S ribosomal protein L1 [Patescibacteria group bacterium]
MGKIKVATLGSEDEKALREKKERQREEKKKREQARKVHIAGLKGGQRIKSLEGDEAEVEKMAKLAEEVEKDQAEGIKSEGEEKKTKKKVRIRVRSQKYKEALMKIDHDKQYSISEAVSLLREVSFAKFGGSVELHINTSEKGLRGNVKLPHGTGKEVRVAIANAETIDKLVEQVEKGKIDFDALVAHPAVMGKLARVAKFLGPKGLMPNPKAGTISPTPEKIAEKFKAGEINWKTESEFPIIHQVIGKMAFKDNQLTENFEAFIKSVSPMKIKAITLKSTMSPAIKVKVE